MQVLQVEYKCLCRGREFQPASHKVQFQSLLRVSRGSVGQRLRVVRHRSRTFDAVCFLITVQPPRQYYVFAINDSIAHFCYVSPSKIFGPFVISRLKFRNTTISSYISPLHQRQPPPHLPAFEIGVLIGAMAVLSRGLSIIDAQKVPSLIGRPILYITLKKV